jgi:hypothetical protein
LEPIQIHKWGVDSAIASGEPGLYCRRA